jgi:hypothetical protein
VRRLLALLALAFSGGAWAGYANVAPPSGFSTSNGVHFYTTSANAPFVNGSAAASVTATVGGRAVVMPAAMRLASNAATFAVSAVRATPQALVVGAVASWLLSHGLEWVDGEWRKTETTPALPGGSVCLHGSGNAICDSSGAALAARMVAQSIWGTWQAVMWVDTVGQQFRLDHVPGGNDLTFSWVSPPACTGGTVLTQSGCQLPSTTRPATEEDWEAVPLQPLPAAVPPALPVPLPIELPTINPSADPVPVPLPYRIPASEPVPVPGTVPQEWVKPYIDVRGSPTPLSPWRIDVQPGSVTEPGPEPLAEGTPSGSTGTPAVPSASPGLCEQYPDIAACKPLGEPDAPAALEVRDVSADFSDRITFGADNAACPADRVMSTALAGTLHFSYSGACMFADGIRPVVLALAYLAAAASFFGIGFARGD